MHIRSHIYRLAAALAAGAALFFPALLFAQGTTGSSGSGTTVATYITISMKFMNTTVIPALFGIAIVIFLWGMAKSFMISGGSEESREKGKSLALWGVLAFVFVLSIWGIANMLVAGFGIGGGQIMCPDYNKNCASQTSGTGTPGGGSPTQPTSPTGPSNPYRNIVN